MESSSDEDEEEDCTHRGKSSLDLFLQFSDQKVILRLGASSRGGNDIEKDGVAYRRRGTGDATKPA